MHVYAAHSSCKMVTFMQPNRKTEGIVGHSGFEIDIALWVTYATKNKAMFSEFLDACLHLFVRPALTFAFNQQKSHKDGLAESKDPAGKNECTVQ